MAIHPNEPYYSQDTLQPGARGERFIANLPGYRTDEQRINRTNTSLNCADHDVPNCKWELDDRLPALFRYGFAYGFNQIVIPKGRVLALDPNMSVVDFETKKAHNVLTLANGGVPVQLRKSTDVYKTLESESIGEDGISVGLISAEANALGEAVNVDKDWAPLITLAEAYSDKHYRPFKATANAAKQLKDKGFAVDAKNGRVVKDGIVDNKVRVGNIPIGILERNEYTRDIDAYNGMMPGPVRTDAMIEMPWFLYKDKAESSFWGSVYGDIRPGNLVKSDENGRLCVSPLSDAEVVAEMTLAEYEAERQQVVGQVYAASMELVPEGAAKWATWALEDRLNFDGFNPATWKATNRKNEDSINNSPYASEGTYPGYPFDKAFNDSNLHMLGTKIREGNYDMRMEQEYQYSELGIPGLTDGYNAVSRAVPAMKCGEIHYRGEKAIENNLSYIDQIFKTMDVNVEKGSLQVALGDGAFVNAVEGQELADGFTIVYVDEKQGMIKIHMDNDKADKALLAAADNCFEVKMKYKKRGLAGVPTFMDWDGVIGSVKILLTK